MIRRTSVLFAVLVLVAGLMAAGLRADEAKSPKPKPTPAAPQKAEQGKPEAKPVKDDDYELQKLLVDTIDQVERNYVKSVTRRELIEAAIKGVLEKLDPYSSYISPNELTSFRNSVESEFGGIGIQVSVEGGQLRVISPLVGTPAYRAGLIAGDRIVEIDGKPTVGITIDQAVRRLKGQPGTNVTLTVVHPGKSKQEKVTIVRQNIHVETVLGDHRALDDSWDFLLDQQRRIAYVRVTAFSRDTARDLRSVLERLQKTPLRALILDLRFNPGGLLNSAIEVSDLFIAEGRIVGVTGRNTPERSWNAHSEGSFLGFPMVVLVNRYSASASEIVAACLQDHKRAVVIGERTWGKGSVQNVIELEEGHSALKLTTASYRRPSGKNIHRFPDSKESDEWGVSPDKGYELKLTDAELIRLVDDRRQRDIVQPKQLALAQPEPRVAAKPAQGKEASGKKPPSSAAAKAQPAEGKADPAKKPEKAASTKKPDKADSPNKPDATKPPEKPAAKTAAPKPLPTGDAPATPLEHAKFVDPQLRMAVDYLTGELARAK